MLRRRVWWPQIRLRSAFVVSSVGALLLFSLGLWIFSDSYLRLARLAEEQRVMNDILSGGFRLVRYTHDALLHGELRAVRQWRGLHASLRGELARRRALSPYTRQVAAIEVALLDLEKLFDTTLATIEQARASGRPLLKDEVYRVQRSQLSIRIAELQSALDGLESVMHHTFARSLGTSGHGLLLKFLLLFGLVGLFGGALWWLFLVRVLRPLGRLEEGIRRIRDGEADFRPAKGADDEIGAAMNAFNDLLDRHQEAERALSRHRRELETKVKERTEALAKSRMAAISVMEDADALRREAEASNQRLASEIEVRRQTEARLQEAVVAADAANKAKSLFLSNMSHELRTPLNAVLGFSQLMGRDPGLTPSQKENLQIINHSGEHLLNLINDVLDMSKIEAGRMQLAPEPLELHRCLEDVAEMMRVRAEGKDLSFLLEQDAHLPRFVRADPGKLRQVLINLIGNAIKFTDQGGVALRARGRPAGDGLLLHFEVEDSGRGIAAEELEHIFAPFVQVGHRAAGGEGTGLGLSITREYVRLMGGDITVTSTPGKGSCFAFELRAAPADEAEVVVPEQLPRVVGLASGQPRYRVLVVEDDQANRLLLSKLLREVGFEVYEAADGAQAVDCYTAFRPHFIWMDMRMPVMDGYEATRRIKALPGGPQTVVVALTATAFSEERDRLLAAGCAEIVRKPYREQEIFETMQHLLRLEFRYEERARLSPMRTGREERAPLLSDSLRRLPGELRSRLHKCLTDGYVISVDAAMNEVAEYDRDLAQRLDEYTGSFRYTELVELLEEAEEHVR